MLKHIENILFSKPNNPHYLQRYIKFIDYCDNIETPINCYTENHHICPKSTDLFPEFSSIKENPWNNIRLTARQHFIAHWMLWKAYGGKQTYAFFAMYNIQSSGVQKRHVKSKNSKIYENIKTETSKLHSSARIGKAYYYDIDGNLIHTNTDDIRVISGELKSLSSGRTLKKRDAESKLISSRAGIDRKWREFPKRVQNLYFLDIKISIEYTRENFGFLEYIEQGWTTYCTPEFISKTSSNTNRNRSEESRKKTGKAISNTLKKKREADNYKPKILSPEQRISRRTKYKSLEEYKILGFDLEKEEYVMIDPLDLTYPVIKCFCRTGGRYIYDKLNNRKCLDKRIKKLPEGFLDSHSNI